MAYLYRPVAVKPVPKSATVGVLNGKKVARWTARGGKPVVAELTPDGKKCRARSPTWWVEYTNHLGKRADAKGFRSREATLQLAARLERTARSVEAGEDSPPDASPKQLLDYLPAYSEHVAAKCTNELHRHEAVAYVRAVLVGVPLTTPTAVNCDHVAAWLARERKTKKWAQQTVNHRVRKLKTFGNWLVKKQKLKFNPFAGLETANPESDRKHVRRAIEHSELLRLVAAARLSTVRVGGLDGRDRAALYLFAAYTGFRISALARLTPEAVEWADGIPFRVFGRRQKNGKPHGVPFHASVGRDLTAWLTARPAGKPLWSGWTTWWRCGARTLRHDMEAARAAYLAEAAGDPAELARRAASDVLVYRDAADEVFDFHSLRVQFVSGLAQAGVSQMAATELAGHSDPKITAAVYARWGRGGALAAEIAKLPGVEPLG